MVVNGAVIKNDGPDVNLVFENRAQILRQKDIMTLEEADTPARRVYIALQCAYMFAERREAHLAEFETLIGDFADAAPSANPLIAQIRAVAADGDLYGALKDCRKLIDHETEILKHVQ